VNDEASALAKLTNRNADLREEIEGMKRQAIVLATQNDRLRAERDRLITFAKEINMLLSLHAGDVSFYATPGHHEAHEWWQCVLGGELRRLPKVLRS
jgi:hypothetical protein